MYAALVVAHTLLLLGPAALSGGERPATKAGLLLVLMMTLAAAATLGLILGRWIYHHPPEDPGAAD